jgi:hypothetical protein
MNIVLHFLKATVWRDKENLKPQQYSTLVLGKFVPQFVANVLGIEVCLCMWFSSLCAAAAEEF